MKKSVILLVLLLCMFSVLNSQNKITEDLKKTNNPTNKTTAEQWRKLALNNLEMWFSNNGINSHESLTHSANQIYKSYGISPEEPFIPDYFGLMFPKVNGKGLVYTEGPVLSGMVEGSVRVLGSLFNLTSLQPGPSIQNLNPADPQYKVYMIRKDWQELKKDTVFMSGPDYTMYDYERDYNEWQIDMGAPYELDGTGKKIPKFIGDEQAWYIMNDLSDAVFYGSSQSCGTEWQALVWAYNLPGALGNVIFRKYTIINKGSHDIENAYLSYWSDPDIGFPLDDLAGCDTNLNLGYVYSSGYGYSGTDIDSIIYNVTPSAVGYLYLQGPAVRSDNPNEMATWNFGKKKGYRNLDMTSFIFSAKSFVGVTDNTSDFSPWSDSLFGLHFYNMIKGLGHLGNNPWINPQTGEPTGILFPGDPVTGTGWNSEYIRDVRITISAGPFTFAVGDTQEVVFAIVVGQGADRLSSITVMKEYALIAKKAYDEYCGTAQTIAVKKPEDIPTEYALSQNYPNPFNPSTVIKYQIPEAAQVSLKVYDVMGKEVAILVNDYQAIGSYDVTFNANGLSSGIYFYKLNANGKQLINKMLLMK